TIGSLTVQVAAEAALAQATGAGAEAVRAATIARETQEALRALAIEAGTEEADLIGRLIERLHEERQAREDRAPLGAAQDRLAALEREADALARVAGQRSLTRDQLQVIASLTERAIDLTSDQAREELRLADAIADRTRAVEMARAASTSWRDGAVAAIHDVAVAAADNAAIAEAAFSGVFSSWQDSFTEFFRDFSRGIADVGDLVDALGDAVLDQVARIAAQSVTASLARTAGAALGLGGAAAGAAGGSGGGVLGALGEWLGLGADAAGLVGGGGSVGTTAARWLGLTSPALPGVPPGPAGIGGVVPAGALSPTGSALAAGIDAAPWGLAGSLAASMLGFGGTGNQWADLGLSTLGSVGGGAAGAALLAPALGAAGGPVGAAAGAFLAMVGGDLLSGLFGGEAIPNASQSIDITPGGVVARAPEGRYMSDEDIQRWGQASQAALVGPLQRLTEALDIAGYGVATSNKQGQRVGLFGGGFGDGGTWTDVESLAEAGVVAVRELALAVAGGDASLADAALVARESTADTADALARQIALAADWEGKLARTEAQYITAGRQMAEMAAATAQWEQGARAVLAPMVETRDILAAAGRDTGDLSAGLEHLAETMLGLHDTALSPVQVAVQTATGQIDALSRMLEDLGYSADRTAGYLAALEEAVIGRMRDQFDEANQDRVYELTGMGAIPDLRAIAEGYVHAMTDAAALGADTALLTRRALLEVQAAVEGMDVAGLSDLIDQVEALGYEGDGVALILDGLDTALDGLGDAAGDTAGQVSGAADRIAAANRGLERRLLAATVDPSTRAGALALFDWDAQRELAELSALGADITLLERVLAEERLDIIQRFTDDAVAAERRRAEEMARAWDQAASVIAGIATDIRQYLDGVYGGASSPLGTHARMDRAVDDFWAAYARAQTGDRAALSAITRYDATARDAIAAYHASSAPADALYAQMTAALESLPDLLSPEQFLADEITAAVTTAASDLSAATDAAADDVGGAVWDAAALLDATWRQLDADSDGGISWAEFQTWAAQDASRITALHSVMGSGFSGYSIRDLYNAIDANGDGTVSQLEWLRAVTGQVEDHTAASAITSDLLYDYLKQMHDSLYHHLSNLGGAIVAAVDRVTAAIHAIPHAAGGAAAGLTVVNDAGPEWIRLPDGTEVVTARASLAMAAHMARAMAPPANDVVPATAATPTIVPPVVVPLPWAARPPAGGGGGAADDRALRLLERIDRRLETLEAALHDEAGAGRRADGALTGELAGHLSAIREALEEATGSAALARRAAVGGRR
ncbi:phage tail tape measure C-terminal domain-containing protein, partial [Roseospira goensis]